MGGTRDHGPIVIEDFNGLWDRGDDETVPLDHFIQADNIQFIHSGIETRDTIEPFQNTSITPKIVRIERIYNYVTKRGQSLLVLSTSGPPEAIVGNIHHMVENGVSTLGPILTIPLMTDFGFVGYNGRAFITPFTSGLNEAGEDIELGLQGQFVYVYEGDGSPARPIGGNKPVGGALTVVEGAAGSGHHDEGFHLVGVVYETKSGFLTAPGPTTFGSATYSSDNTKAINVSNIPVSPDTFVIKRHLVSTRAITDYNGDQNGYQFYFIPEGSINDNTTTTKTVSYFDADLIDDASHLTDTFASVAAGVNLTIYHNRMVLVGQYDDPSVARISAPGEPESFNQIDGLVIAPLDGRALTNCQEFRDVLYLFKKTMTIAYSDNDDEPASWGMNIIDQAVGAPVHGIATVLDSGGVNIDFLLIADYSGLMLFNGTYARPELSWKIDDVWTGLIRGKFRHIQLVNDNINKKIWITLMDPWRMYLMHANYANGLDAKSIRWSKWAFSAHISSVALIRTDDLILGSNFDTDHDGVFQVVKGTRDKFYAGLEMKIPDPTIRTALIGD